MPLPYIMILIIVSLILIFLYLVEPFITRQKIKDNNEHGSARWSTLGEIKKNFREESISHIKESGFPIYFSKDNKRVWFDNQTPHWIILGSTGSGKSVTSVIPYCSFIATATKKKSVFITDPKGEIFQTTSQMFKDNGYDVLTLDFRNPEFSNHNNLLHPALREYELYDKYLKLSNEEKDEKKAMEYKNKSIVHFAQSNQLVNDLSNMIMNDETAKEKFWNNSACDLLYGIIFLFFEEYVDNKIKREQVTLTSIKKFQNSSMTDTNNKNLKKYIESKTYDMKSKDKLLPLLNTSETTYRSITSTFNERMSLYDDVNVENITSNSDFELDDLGKKPTVLYCCIPDESKIYYSLVSIIVSLMYKTLVMLCNEQENKKLPYDLVFLLDEFGNTPPLNDIISMTSVGRSRGLFYNYYLQSLQQLDNLYGKEVSQIIQDNCGLAYLKTNTQETAEAVSVRIGSHGVMTTSLNYSMSFTNNNGSKGTSLIARRLLTADEIKQLHYKTIIFPTIGHPIFRDTVTYDKFSSYQKGCIQREKRPLERLVNTYFTVDQLVKVNSNQNVVPQKVESNPTLEENRKLLEKIANEVLNIFGKVDFNIEYNIDKLQADVYLAPPLSTSDIALLQSLTEKYHFTYNAISSKEKINRKNRNSKIEIFLSISNSKLV
ncbi:MAG: type IV secretory system conjugative DNA transfer family protein [Bacilli bacterium]|nr:type IV secretory system conjugative DNA transfer family protein [Bacilli bacterium]